MEKLVWCTFVGTLLYFQWRKRVNKQPGKFCCPTEGLDDREVMYRYGRQLVLKGFGPEGQAALLKAKVLVLGAGGIGSPILAQLAGAGVAEIGVMDADVVDVSNLHRQTLHGEDFAGQLKVESAKFAMRRINRHVKVNTYPFFLEATEECLEIVARYDLIIEATDSLASKYVANDMCIMLNKPFLCGAAQGLEGQLGLYLPGGPCYRCMFPKPVSIENRLNCSDNGVLGPVPNWIGSLQALMAIRYFSTPQSKQEQQGIGKYFYMCDGINLEIRRLKFPTRRKATCVACGPSKTIHSVEDSERFCQEHDLHSACHATDPLKIVQHTTWSNFHETYVHEDHLLLDVRPSVQYRIWNLPNSVNIPLQDLVANPTELLEPHLQSRSTIFTVCRRGNSSIEAAKILHNTLPSTIRILNLQGGLERLARSTKTHPIY